MTSLLTRRAAGNPEATEPKRRRQIPWPLIAGVVTLIVLISLPNARISLQPIFDGYVSSSQTLLILASSLIFAGLAVSYDVVFGYAGMLSAGHATVFAAAVYSTNMLMEHGVAFFAAIPVAVAVATVLGAIIGALSLRTKALAFTMVTLAFGEVFSTLLVTDPFRVFGGEEGKPLAYGEVPATFLQARDVKNLYWLALGTLVVIFLLALQATRSRCGRVWTAIRENEERAEMIGLRTYVYKLIAFTYASVLAGIAGSVYLVVVRAANPSSASVEFSLAMIVMVVIGGRGRLWGAAVGGFLYGILTLRLPSLASSDAVAGLPDWLQRIIGEPLFVLGIVFMAVVLFAPAGLGGLVDTVGRRLQRRRTKSKTAAS